MKSFYSTVCYLLLVISLSIEISQDIIKKIDAFIEVIDIVIKEKSKEISDYVNVILYIGLQRMIIDLFPENELLQKSMLLMFEENPIFVSKFIAERIKDGTLTPEEKWPLDIT